MSECAITLQAFFRGLSTSKSSQVKKDASVAIVCVMMKVGAEVRVHVCHVLPDCS